jgi:peptidoglycan/LPS O-acetylase OafA/YrhL
MTGHRLKSLDFLRGIAILGVVCFHVNGLFPADNSALQLVAGQGFFGVQLFFVVSALTMCLMWERRAGEYYPTVKFYIRRFFRIAPPFWLAIIFYSWLGAGQASEWAPAGLSVRHFATTAAFVHTFWPDTINSVVPGGWSIGVEMLFYLFFPFIISWRCRPHIFLLIAFAIYLFNIFAVRPTSLALLHSYPYPSLVQQFLYFQFFNQAPIFLAGIWLYKFLHLPEKSYFWPAIIGLIWIALAFFLKVVLGFNSAPFFWLPIAGLLLAAYVVLSLQISWWPLNRLGAMSYSIYLTHFAVVRGVELLFRAASIDAHETWVFGLALALTVSCCVALGSLLEATIESWSSALGKYIVGSLRSPPKSSGETGSQYRQKSA